jgi:hypothetical protein
LEFDAFSSSVEHIDIVIQAYSTNDMHIHSVSDAQEKGTTLGELGMEYAQAFVRTLWEETPTCHNNNNNINQTTITTVRPRHRPLLLWVDDYLGNEQRTIVATTELNQKIQVLASYYGFASMSLGHAVRDVVYADTHTTLFAPRWYVQENNATTMVRQIHPEQGMHLSMVYSVAYNLLNMAITYCSTAPSLYSNLEEAGSTTSSTSNLDKSTLAGKDRVLLDITVPRLRRTSEQLPLFSRQPPDYIYNVLPPPLTPSLRLDDVSALWKQDAEAIQALNIHNRTSTLSACDEIPARKCMFSWVNGMDPTQSIAVVQHLFQPFVVSKGGWKISEYRKSGKYGWHPTQNLHPSTLTLQFTHVTQPIRRVGVFYMKSYGPKWDNSTTRLDFFTRRNPQYLVSVPSLQHDDNNNSTDWTSKLSMQLLGYHAKQTTETYVERIRFDEPVTVSDSLRINMTFLDGMKFKLQGLALCS